MKLTNAFRCVPPGEIYPVELAAGEDCPEEYEDSARAQGCLGKAAPPPKGEQPKGPQPKADQAESGPEEAPAISQPQGG